MFRRFVLASALVALSAALAPAHALNPQPLPPSPCKCDAFKRTPYKYDFLKRYYVNQYYLKRHAAR